MRKFIKVLSLVLCIFMITGCNAGQLSDKYNEEEVKTASETVINNLNDNYWYGTTQILLGKEGLKSVGIDETKILLEKELASLQMLLGETEVQGQGIVITIKEGENEIFLIVNDETINSQAHGKQSFQKDSWGCFYTRTTGIWQNVW